MSVEALRIFKRAYEGDRPVVHEFWEPLLPHILELLEREADHLIRTRGYVVRTLQGLMLGPTINTWERLAVEDLDAVLLDIDNHWRMFAKVRNLLARRVAERQAGEDRYSAALDRARQRASQ